MKKIILRFSLLFFVVGFSFLKPENAFGTKGVHFAFLHLPLNAEIDHIFSVGLTITDSDSNTHDLTLKFSKTNEEKTWSFWTKIGEEDDLNQKKLRFNDANLLRSVNGQKTSFIEIEYVIPGSSRSLEKIQLHFGDGNQTDGLCLYGQELSVGRATFGLSEANYSCVIL